MPYQIFSRQSHIGGDSSRRTTPHRICTADTIEEARRICTARNDKRSKREIRDGFHYEFADAQWYVEAFD
jgi:hypothetical protein